MMQLALIAGRGSLPAAVAAAATTPPLVCVLDGFQPDDLQADITFRIETLGTLIQTLAERGITHVCMCGAVKRPQIDPAALDALTLPLVPVLQAALSDGDDGALRAIIGIFQAQGLQIIGAHEAAPDLLPPAGVLSKSQPSGDIAAGISAAQGALIQMGQADLGQACVVRGDRVVATEDDAGTDAMLSALDGDMTGGFLFKAPKPDQDQRADLPTIGPHTVTAAKQVGLAGIVVAAQEVMVLDLPAVLEACDQAGVFLWVRQG